MTHGSSNHRTLKIVAWPMQANAARNPVQKMLYASIAEDAGYEVIEFSAATLLLHPSFEILHLHWPDVFVASGQGLRFWLKLLALRGAFLFARLRGAKIVWTAHNIRRGGQQNGTQMERWFWPWFMRRVDGIIFMTRASAEQARQENSEIVNTPYVVIPHGSYLPVIGAAPFVAMDEDADMPPQALFFGSISRYKNVWKLLDAFLGLAPGRARLRISGKMSRTIPDEKLREALSDLPAERAGEILFENRFVPDEELVSIIRAADLVVFPYADVLNSGAAIYALSAGRPLLASDNALFRELQGQAGPRWVTLIEGELGPEQLSAALEAARTLRRTGSEPDLSVFDWDDIAQQTVSFYEQLVTGNEAQ